MWHQFEDLGEYEHCVIDTAGQDPAETSDQVCERLLNGGQSLAIG
jgi:hypothetical protein